MEDSKQNPGQSLSPDQVASISGGDGTSCPSSVTVGTNTSVTGTGATPADALISVYEGFVDLTSHMIDRLVGTQR
jgi:hypothetical protein